MKITFTINFFTSWGQKLYIVGSLPELGSWIPALAKEMQYTENGNWCYELETADSPDQLSYHYLLSDNGIYIPEPWSRSHQVSFHEKHAHYYLKDNWLNKPVYQAFYSAAFSKSWFAHTEQPGDSEQPGSRIRVKFHIPALPENQYLVVAGNQPCLGNWNTDRAPHLHYTTYPEWIIELDRDELTFPVEYKFIICNRDNGEIVWETGDNRRIDEFPADDDTLYVLSETPFRGFQSFWHCAGTVIPVFSLRSEESCGVGDLKDLRKMVDWAALTQQRIIQVLPMNDTTASYTWTDSYPYSAISIYALHPVYISLSDLGQLKDRKIQQDYADKQRILNQQETLDYEAVMRHKMNYCRSYFAESGQILLQSEAFIDFFKTNESWLKPYAAFSYLRDFYQTADFTCWKSFAVFDPAKVNRLCTPSDPAYDQISFYYLLQFILHTQFKAVSDYAHAKNVVLKGDLPIGISRHSVEAWTEPGYFRMNMQAGAPPDDFSANGQNWLFPTYNWKEMEKNNFVWWKNRFKKLEDYLDCFRIDHILGFFRIWEIPETYVQGLCGHFNPALPLSKAEIEQFGFPFDAELTITPFIHRQYLHELFGELSGMATDTYLVQVSSEHYRLKSFCDTQQKIAAVFKEMTDPMSLQLKSALFHIANEVLFLKDPYQKDAFHPRISASQSYRYRELPAESRQAFDKMYWHFFYHRHNQFWKEEALKKLIPLINGTQMLVCGEDLGMIPDSVPEVMHALQILSLEIERMPKSPHVEFTDLMHLPYLSVCTTSTHDMSPLRSWWKEDRIKTQRYYNTILGHVGQAPEDCSSAIAEEILRNHLESPSMLVIIPLQDWLAMDDRLKNPDPDAERINIPAQTNHYWRYRMHLTIEQLIQETAFNQKIESLIRYTKRS